MLRSIRVRGTASPWLGTIFLLQVPHTLQFGYAGCVFLKAKTPLIDERATGDNEYVLFGYREDGCIVRPSVGGIRRHASVRAEFQPVEAESPEETG